MANAPPITLLHLSDLQFGPHHRFERADAPGALLHRLREDLSRMRDEEALAPDLVLLTGDLTEYGLRSQFTEMLSFVHGLLEVTGLGPRRIVMVPGNHDINWKLSEAYFAERLGNEEKPQRPYWPKLKHYAELLAKFYEGQPGLGFTEAEPWTFYEYPELKVVVAGLDSTLAESHRPEDHHGFLGEPQLDFFAGKLRPYKERGWLRIGAVHHDPMHPENEAARQDAKDLKGRLLPYLNLVVHGHIHEEQLGWLHATTPVLGIGSAAVNVPERPPEVPNQYQWVRVFPDRVEYGTRAYVPDQKRWVGCLRSDRAGKHWKLTERVAFEGVGETFSGKGGVGKAPDADLAAMVDAYRRHWANAYRREALFDLATMGEDADIPAGLDLLHVFLPQAAQREVLRDDWQPEPVGAPSPVDEIVTDPDQRWLLVLGAPGAGKSALTRWVVLKLCVPAETFGSLSRDLVPVRIELRRFDLQYHRARQTGRSYDFFDYLDELHRERHLSLHGEPLRRLAEAGRVFWLFDGLDEVYDAQARLDYAEMIVGVRQRYQGHGVITSRVLGARVVQPLFAQAAFATCVLQDFDDARIALFLQRWHRIAFSGAADAAERRLDRLLRTLRENASVRALCGNPLLLTFIALLNRGADLPRQRHRVYERTVDLMAEHWEANKRLPLTISVRLDLPIKKRFLRQLAFKMMTEMEGGAGNAIHQGDLLRFASDFCAREYMLKAEEAHATAEHLIEHLRERNHILALLGGDLFGFVHKTLLEYLAALEILVRLETHVWNVDHITDVFKRTWRNPGWRETLLLVCAMLQEERPDDVVLVLARVIAELAPFGGVAAGGRSFVERCLVEVGSVERDPMKTFALLLSTWKPEPEDHAGFEATDANGLPRTLDVSEARALARSDEDDASRLEGAALLAMYGEAADVWRPILTSLARSAKRGSARLRAAKILVDERRIAQLAGRSRSPKVRADAARALEQLRVYGALVAVGRPAPSFTAGARRGTPRDPASPRPPSAAGRRRA